MTLFSQSCNTCTRGDLIIPTLPPPTAPVEPPHHQPIIPYRLGSHVQIILISQLFGQIEGILEKVRKNVAVFILSNTYLYLNSWIILYLSDVQVNNLKGELCCIDSHLVG